MRETQLISVRVSGTKINGTNANTSASSDAIEMPLNKKWSLSIWFDSLSVTSTYPTVTIYGSNTNDVDSKVVLDGYQGISLPESFYKDDMPFKYLWIDYDPQDATAGTKYFDLEVEL